MVEFPHASLCSMITLGALRAAPPEFNLSDHLRELTAKTVPRVNPSHRRRQAAPAIVSRDPKRGHEIDYRQQNQGPAASHNGKGHDRQRHTDSPEPGTPRFSHEMAVRPATVNRRDLGVRVARAHGPLPPLAQARHGRVVPGHRRVEPHDLPARRPHAEAQIVILRGDDRWIEAADLAKRLGPDEKVAAAGGDLAHRPVPFDRADAVVDRTLGLALHERAADSGRIVALLERHDGPRQPFGIELAVTIEELHEFDAWRQFVESREAFIPRTARGERRRHVELDDFDANRAREFDAQIRRAGIDIHDRRAGAAKRAQATAQPVAFVATNDDDSELFGSLGGYIRWRRHGESRSSLADSSGHVD